MVGAEHLADGFDDFGAGGADDHHVPAGGVVLLDEGGGLVIDDGVDQIVQGLGDDLPYLLHIPAAAQLREVFAHPFHLIVVRTTDQVDELGICGPQYRSSVDEPAVVEGSSEGERARLGDHGLVEIEERRGARGQVVFHGMSIGNHHSA